MKKFKTTTIQTILIICIFFFSYSIHSQDTIRLKRKPNVILKSWYPKFKDFPKLKIGQSKILFTKVPDFEKTSIWNNTIDLKCSNPQIDIENTEKTNQYLITVNPTNEKNIEFELWFELSDTTILIQNNSKWRAITQLYPTKGNKVLIDKIQLELIR
ncbi:hypothetical protein [Aquimarina litoralis]|uniref:hypothetical protein n=1 Tax=Aquimarina litoralis TaxID=584605 RepID=UPI001C58BBD6|nr:hypothetical protein [Aquimarina litoralis]MBW1299023.1 hypothetical protein [Aquimarina litoralis]